MPVEKIILRNFQKHERRSVELHPRATSLIGASDAGKTTVLRAVRWLALKDFPTKSALRDGAADVRVSVRIDGRKVTRSAGAEGNWYELDGKRFAAMGGAVPDEIASLLAIGEENFADQHAAHFWFSLTAGQASKELNRIVNLDVIDAALAEVGVRSRRAKIEVDLVRGRLVEARKRLDALDWVEDALEQLAAVEKKYNQVIQDEQRAAEIDSLVMAAENAQAVAARCLEASRAAERVVDAGREALAPMQEADALEVLIGTAEEQGKWRSRPVPDLTALETARARWEEAERGVTSLAEDVDRAEASAADLAQLEGMAASMQDRLTKATAGRTCPTCGQPWGKP